MARRIYVSDSRDECDAAGARGVLALWTHTWFDMSLYLSTGFRSGTTGLSKVMARCPLQQKQARGKAVMLLANEILLPLCLKVRLERDVLLVAFIMQPLLVLKYFSKRRGLCLQLGRKHFQGVLPDARHVYVGVKVGRTILLILNGPTKSKHQTKNPPQRMRRVFQHVTASALRALETHAEF